MSRVRVAHCSLPLAMAAVCAAVAGIAVTALAQAQSRAPTPMQALAQAQAAAPARPAAPTPAANARPGDPAAGVAAPSAVEFTYVMRAGDTLIGIASRLLLEPRRWPELQRRNGIADPRRIPRAGRIRIPYDWLRLSPGSATVLERVGTVRVDGREVAPGSIVATGAAIETEADGALTLEFGDGSTLIVQRSTRLRLTRLQRVEGAGAEESVLELERGKVEMKVRPRGAMGRFEIHTPAAVSAVRGTDFRAAFNDDGAATTETLDGTVGVDGAGSGVALHAGFGTRAERGRPPLEPVPLLPAPSLDALPVVNDTATLQWAFAPVAGAASYRHQLARDAEFRSLVAEIVTPRPQATFEAPADGRYWLRARAIDAAAIEGLDATHAIEQRRRLDAPQALAPIGGARQVGAITRFEWQALATASGYRFQLASDPQFARLVAERTLAAVTGEAPATQVESLPAGDYVWRIAAVDAAGIQGHWSAPQAFAQKPLPVAAEPLPATVTTTPALPSFRWEATGSGQNWQWQLARNEDFDRVLRSGRSGEPALTLEPLPPGRYWLRVRTIDADGFEGPYGEARPFDVPWPAWVRFLVPMILLLPIL